MAKFLDFFPRSFDFNSQQEIYYFELWVFLNIEIVLIWERLAFMINLEEFYYNNRLPNFLLQKQKFINPQMRTILLNWILEVTSQLGFKRETYHLTVFLIDSFLQNYENLQTSEFQLLGVTCLMISSKFEVRIYNYKNN